MVGILSASIGVKRSVLACLLLAETMQSRGEKLV
jgi:hypothetical protein